MPRTIDEAITELTRAIECGTILHFHAPAGGIITVGPYHTAVGPSSFAAFWYSPPRMASKFGEPCIESAQPWEVARWVVARTGRKAAYAAREGVC